MNSFRVGMKVVCVEREQDPFPPNPVYGVVYTVSWVGSFDAGVVIDLVELPSPATTIVGRGYFADCFRPAVEPGTETGMSILRELLNTQDQPVRADA